MTRLVLASGSPRRRELLSAIVRDFDIVPADIPEDLTPDGRADALRLSRGKAVAVAFAQPDALVIGSDTTVHDERQSYGKPADAADATAILTSLRGRRHLVTTGVAVVSRGVMDVRYSETQVQLSDLSDAQIEAYVASGRPFDKAGAYAIQDEDVPTVERIDGCYCCVMGLPLWRLKRMLEACGVRCDEPDRTLPQCVTCPERNV